jgi:hypothetical protein
MANWFGGSSGGKKTNYAQLIQKQSDDTLAKQKANADALVARTSKLADQLVATEDAKSNTWRANQGALDSSYLSRVQGQTDTYSKLLNEIFAEEKGVINQYETDTKDLVTKSAQQAIDFNLDNVDNFISFANSLTFAAQESRRELLRTANPYLFEQQEQISKNNLDLVSGRLPAAALAQSTRSSAYAALQSGVGGGSGMGRATEARNLGLDTLAAMKAGEQSAASWADLTFRQQVEGLQTTPGQVAERLGVDARTVAAFNAANAEKILGARQGVFAQQRTGLNAVLAANLGAADSVYRTGSAMEGNLYSGAMSTATQSANMKSSSYDMGARLYGGAIQDWGTTRTKVLSTQWQNQILREEAQKQNNAALISGLATVAGGAIGLIATGGNPAGAMVGASLGGAAGGAIAGGSGNASSGVPKFGDIWGSNSAALSAYDYRNSKANGGVQTFNTSKELFQNTNQDWMKGVGTSTSPGASYTNWGGWIPKATAASSPTFTTR